MATRGQVVGNQHSMAAEVHSLSAHDCDWPLITDLQQLVYAIFELFGQHVIGIIPKRFVSQGNIRRFLERPLSSTAELSEPSVFDSRLGQFRLQTLAVEVRQATGHGKSANIDERLDPVRMKS